MRFAITSITIFSLIQALSAAPATLVARQSNTRNDLRNGACKEYTLIFARGTLEPAGNLGSVGTPFAAALERVLGENALAVQGVNYSPDFQGAILGGDPAGSQAMAALVARACASTTVILAGYSQGAQLVHNAAAKLSTANARKVGAVVLFGDPERGRALAKGLSARSRTFCHAGDQICAGGFNITPAHKSYPSDCGTAANFVKSKVT
ncbi:Cutinase [Dactylellina cionopaga]|nr:Cutinase [Dactylellina cionopaga]